MQKTVYKDRDSLREEALKLRNEGYGYLTISKRLGIATTTVQRWVGHIKVDWYSSYRKAVDERCSLSFPTSKSAIRARLLKEQERKCSKCKRKTWLGKPITLEVEHIDGNNKNNDVSNLILLCPNCHSYTDTWRRKKTSFASVSQLAEEIR